MLRSDAFPPARSNRRVLPSAISLFALLTLSVYIPCLIGCVGLSNSGSGKSGNGKLTLSGTLPTAEVGVAFNAVLSVSGGSAPYTFAAVSGSLPPGLSLSQGTGTISGTPTQSGTFSFTIQVSDSAGDNGSNSFQLSVSSANAISVTVSPANATVVSLKTQQFTAAVTNTSNVAVTWSATAGTINSSGGYTAPKVSANTAATVTATSVADPAKSGKASLTITASTQPPSLSIITTSLPGATAGTAYSTTLQATGGTSPYKWTLSSGTLPTGFSLQSSGELSGTTSQTGPFSLTIQASDSSSPQQTASKTFTLMVSTAGSGPTVSNFFFAADFNKATDWPATDGLGQSATLSGIRLWDDGVKWGQLNTADGVYDWTALDVFLGNAQSGGMDVLYTFGDTPQFAAITTPPGTCLQAGPYSCAPPIDVNADGTGTDAYFQAFVTALVTHAAGRISYYELWNEPDCTCFWSGNTAQLVRMSKDAAAIIRSLDPNAKILSPSAHGPTMATWFDGYIAAGGASSFDIVNVHMRGEGTANANADSFLTVWGQVQTELQARNLTTLPVWDDEHGILTGQLTDPDMLAGYVAQSIALRAGVGLQRQYIYMWDSVAPYGLQASESGTAWDEVASWLIGHSISPCTTSGSVYTCQLDNGEIVWDASQTCSSGVCTTSSYVYPTKYAWYREMTSGNQYTLTGTTVQIGYKPILLTNQ